MDFLHRLMNAEAKIQMLEYQLFKVTKVMEEKFPEHFAGEAETIPDPELKPIDLRGIHAL